MIKIPDLTEIKLSLESIKLLTEYIQPIGVFLVFHDCEELGRKFINAYDELKDLQTDMINAIADKKKLIKPDCCDNCNTSGLEDDFIQRYNESWLCKDCISDKETKEK